MTRALRHRLFGQFALVAALPFLLAALIGASWFYRYLQQEIRLRQEQLAHRLAGEIEIYLQKAAVVVQGVALQVPTSPESLPLSHSLNQQIISSQMLRSLFIVDPRGRLAVLGLNHSDQLLHDDLLGLDLSHNPLWRDVKLKQKTVWSDIYLSVIGGGLTVAVGVPAAGDCVVIGEIDLVRLSQFLRTAVLASDQEVLIIDRRGEVIADQEGHLTAQQLNLGHLPLIRDAISTGNDQSGELTLEGETMVARLVQVPPINWQVLVALPSSVAYRPLHLMIGTLGVSLLAALLVGLLAALRMAKLLAQRFESLTEHARLVAEGAANEAWPRSDIREFEDLGSNLEQMSRAIREQERQLSILMSNLPGMVHRSTADDECRILFASRGSEALLGICAEDLETKHCSIREMIHPEDRERVWEEISECLRLDRSYEITFRIVTRNGQTKWIWGLGQGGEKDGQPVIEGFMTDISRRVHAEMALRDALARAEEANRAKNEFLANMSHELRTPLNGVLGMLQLLEKSTELTKEQREFIKIADSSGWNLLNLLNDILDLSRIEAGRMELLEEETDVADLASDVLQIFRLSAREKGTTLQLVLADGLSPRVGVDPVRLRQILFNLVGNAVKFTDAGLVTLTVGPLITGRSGRGQIELTVADNGIGMSETTMARLFTPFSQGESSFRRRFQGAGLGLSIVRRLVDLMHGTIEIASREGEGCIVTVVIDVCMPQQCLKEELPMKEQSEDKTAPGLRVLLAEDSRTNQLALRMMLEKDGHTVETADNGLQALEMLSKAPFDLVLMDVQMPELDGVEATRRIRADRSGSFDPRIPIIAITAYAMTGDREKFLASGMDDYLAKPVVWQELSSILERWRFRIPGTLESDSVWSGHGPGRA